MIYLTLVIGLVTLVFAGDALVRGSVGLAQKFKVPPLIIGLTIVALGTSAPELMVAVEAALSGAPGLALGNIIGSNITNILLVLGVPTLICAIKIDQVGIRRNMMFMIAISLLLIGFMFTGVIGRFDALILLVLLGYFLFENARVARRNNIAEEDMFEELNDAPSSNKKISLLILVGVIGLPLGGSLTTGSALDIAALWGVADSTVGLTIVALGTSLPELATGISAALRKQSAVAIGNVIGSNVFNILAILGITALIKPLDVEIGLVQFDVWVMLACSVFLAPIVLMRKPLGRPAGVLMVAAYIVYFIFVFQK